jgi:hypothetical protein
MGCDKSSITDATRGAGTVYPSKGTRVFRSIRIVRSLVFCVMLCRSLFVLLYFLFWPLYCLTNYFYRFRNVSLFLFKNQCYCTITVLSSQLSKQNDTAILICIRIYIGLNGKYLTNLTNRDDLLKIQQ